MQEIARAARCNFSGVNCGSGGFWKSFPRLFMHARVKLSLAGLSWREGDRWFRKRVRSRSAAYCFSHFADDFHCGATGAPAFALVFRAILQQDLQDPAGFVCITPQTCVLEELKVKRLPSSADSCIFTLDANNWSNMSSSVLSNFLSWAASFRPPNHSPLAVNGSLWALFIVTFFNNLFLYEVWWMLLFRLPKTFR